MCERERGGRKRHRMLLASAFWHLMRTENVGDTQLLLQVACADVKGLLDVFKEKGHLLQGAAKVHKYCTVSLGLVWTRDLVHWESL